MKPEDNGRTRLFSSMPYEEQLWQRTQGLWQFQAYDQNRDRQLDREELAALLLKLTRRTLPSTDHLRDPRQPEPPLADVVESYWKSAGTNQLVVPGMPAQSKP